MPKEEGGAVTYREVVHNHLAVKDRLVFYSSGTGGRLRPISHMFIVVEVKSWTLCYLLSC